MLFSTESTRSDDFGVTVTALPHKKKKLEAQPKLLPLFFVSLKPLTSFALLHHKSTAQVTPCIRGDQFFRFAGVGTNSSRADAERVNTDGA